MAITTTVVDKIGSSVPTPLATDEYTKKSAEALAGQPALDAETSLSSSMFDELVGGLASQAKDMMAGKIPTDVQDQIRQMSAENTLKGGQGMGSQASKFITARDLGLSSLDIMKQGQTIADSTAKLAETRREYNKTYQLNVANYLDSVRKTDISDAELRERSRQFNVQQNMAVSELLSTTLAAYHETGYKYAVASAEYPSMDKTSIPNMQKDFSGLIDLLRKYVTT